MSRRNGLAVPLAAVMVGAWLSAASPALAGDRVRAPSQTPVRAQPAGAVFLRPMLLPVTISLTLAAPARPAIEEAFINLRGPDGRLRRFAVEGGPEAVSRRVIVLRPGESLTIQLTANK